MSDLTPSHEATEDVHRQRTFDNTQDRIETLVSHSTRLKSLAVEAKRKYASKPALLDGSERLFEELEALADTLLELCSDFETVKGEDVSGEDQEGQAITKCRAICYLNTVRRTLSLETTHYAVLILCKLWDMVQVRVYEMLAQLEAFTAGE